MEGPENQYIHKVEVTEVLDHSAGHKSIALLAEIDGKPGVLKMEKKAFENNLEAARLLCSSIVFSKLSHSNDIYYKYQMLVSPGTLLLPDSQRSEKEPGNQISQEPTKSLNINGVSCELIFPATEKIIAKTRSTSMHIILETKEVYERVTLPWILKNPASEISWLINILEGRAEQENIILSRPEWILTKDYKQDNIGQKENFHYLALFFDTSLRSIRDLEEKHLPLLKEVLQLGVEAISKELSVPSSEIRVYFHYLPTFFLMHVHFDHVKEEGPGVLTERAHMLSTVISNLELMPDYYQRVSLPLRLKDHDAKRYMNA